MTAQEALLPAADAPWDAAALRDALIRLFGGTPILLLPDADLAPEAERLVAAFRDLGIRSRSTDPAPSETPAEGEISVLITRATTDAAALRQRLKHWSKNTSTPFAVLLVAPAPDTTDITPDAARVACDQAVIDLGLRRHPLILKSIFFGALETERWPLITAYQPIPAAARGKNDSLAALAEERDLHMDMLREAGRRSDAHLARYTLACDFIRPGDTILDCACGLGYGAAILLQASPASKVIGVDLSPRAVAYASRHYRPDPAAAEFRTGDAADLSAIPDASVDAIVSFETLEHVPDPQRVLAEFNRILTPGGRLIASVPNRWAVDAAETDPGPFHQHVYTWNMFRQQLGAGFLVERAYRQHAGGWPSFPNKRRALSEIDLDKHDSPDDPAAGDKAEWWILVGMKSPVGATKQGYRETIWPEYPDHPEQNVTAFARDMDNPWLFRSLISVGMRASRPTILREIAEGTLKLARPGSPDQGAALCVLGHQLVGRLAVTGPARPETEAAARDLLEQLAAYQHAADDTPHGHRWRISNQYVAALLRSRLGDPEGARRDFLACAAMDATRFSPLLATKTVDAWFQAGRLAATAGDADEARRCWLAGMTEAQRVLTTGSDSAWVNIWGDPARPTPYGLYDAALVLDTASQCAAWMDSSRFAQRSPALAWRLGSQQTFGDARRWIQELSRAKTWLEDQLAAARAAAESAAAAASAPPPALPDDAEHRRLVEWNDELQKAKQWADDQASSWKAAADRSNEHAKSLANWNSQLQEAKQWLDGQVASMRQEVANHAAALAQRQNDVATLTDQLQSWRAAAAAGEATITSMRSLSDELRTSRDSLTAQSTNLAQRIAELEARSAPLETELAELRDRERRARDASASWKKILEEREREIIDLRARLTSLTLGLEAKAAADAAAPADGPNGNGAAEPRPDAKDDPAVTTRPRSGREKQRSAS